MMQSPALGSHWDHLMWGALHVTCVFNDRERSGYRSYGNEFGGGYGFDWDRNVQGGCCFPKMDPSRTLSRSLYCPPAVRRDITSPSNEVSLICLQPQDPQGAVVAEAASPHEDLGQVQDELRPLGLRSAGARRPQPAQRVGRFRSNVKGPLGGGGCNVWSVCESEGVCVCGRRCACCKRAPDTTTNRVQPPSVSLPCVCHSPFESWRTHLLLCRLCSAPYGHTRVRSDTPHTRTHLSCRALVCPCCPGCLVSALLANCTFPVSSRMRTETTLYVLLQTLWVCVCLPRTSVTLCIFSQTDAVHLLLHV